MENFRLTWDEYLKGAQTVGVEFAELFGLLPDTGIDSDKMDERIHLLQKLPLQRRLMLLYQIGSCIDIPVECLPLCVSQNPENLSFFSPKDIENQRLRRLVNISYYLENFVDEDLLPVFFYCLGFDKSADPFIKKIIEKRKRRIKEFWSRPVSGERTEGDVSPE